MFKNRYILLRNLAVFFITCELMSGLFPFPPGIWRIGLVLVALITVIFKEGKRLLCEKVVMLFVVFNLFHFFISYLWITPNTSQIGNMLCGLLSLSLFTCLSQKGVIDDRFITVIGVVLIMACIYKYYYQIAKFYRKSYSDDEDFTNNMSTPFLMLMPMLFLFKKKVEKWIILTLCLFYIIMSAKRGNILASIIPILLFVIAAFRNNRKSLFRTLLIVLVIVVVSFFVYNWFLSNDYLMLRLEKTAEGYSSGRDVIYKNAWHAWHDSFSFWVYLLGFGYDGTIHHPLMRGMHAHNDWLEILVDYGLLGIVLYLLIFIGLFSQMLKTKVFDSRMVLMSAIFIWFFKTLYSMGFTESSMSLLMISVGKVLGDYKVEKGMT